MLTAATSTLASNALGIGMSVLVIVLLWWSISRARPCDRVSWEEFERQFAEYVADRAGHAQAQMRDGRDQRPPEKDRPSARRPE